MTDIYKGVRRAMHAAVLYNRDRRFAGLVLDALRGEPGLTIGDNEPYFVSDETDYTIPQHGEGRGLPHVEIEIRQDLIFGAAGQDEWALRITRALQAAARSFSGGQTHEPRLEPRGRDRAGTHRAAVRGRTELQLHCRAVASTRNSSAADTRPAATGTSFAASARARCRTWCACSRPAGGRGIEVTYTVIESLTADGRDRSLDYKITGFNVPKGSP